MSKEEADEAYLNLLPVELGGKGEVEFQVCCLAFFLHNTLQQWYHMPDRKHPDQPLHKLRRIKRALANKTADGLTPYYRYCMIPSLVLTTYRFPVNDQDRYKILTPITPTIEKIRQRVSTKLGINPTHCVVLLYRGGNDCIGFHKDKTLDLDETAPITSVTLGVERPYVLRDDIFKPSIEQQFVLPHGALLELGAKTNQEFYHSVKQVSWYFYNHV